MGNIDWQFLLFTVCVAGLWIWRTWPLSSLGSDKMTREQIEGAVTESGYNFEVIINLISEMSPKAQATFAYLYVQKVSKNKKLFGTIRRYMDMQATETGLKKPLVVKGKSL